MVIFVGITPLILVISAKMNDSLNLENKVSI